MTKPEISADLGGVCRTNNCAHLAVAVMDIRSEAARNGNWPSRRVYAYCPKHVAMWEKFGALVVGPYPYVPGEDSEGDWDA